MDTQQQIITKSFRSLSNELSNSKINLIHSFSKKEISTRNNEEALGILMIQLMKRSESYKHIWQIFKLLVDLTQNKDNIKFLHTSLK